MSSDTSEARLDKLELALTGLAAESRELRLAIGGGDLTGKPGVLQNQLRMITALFDDKEGVVPRLTAMERRELERTGWIKGAYFMWLFMGGVIGFLLTKFVFK